MNEKTLGYIEYIKNNHKDFGGQMNGAAVAKYLGISQGRISQLIKEMRGQSKEMDSAKVNIEPLETAEA